MHRAATTRCSRSSSTRTLSKSSSATASISERTAPDHRVSQYRRVRRFWRSRTAAACSSRLPACRMLVARRPLCAARRIWSAGRRSEDRQELDGDPNKNKGGHYEDKFALTLNFRKCVPAPGSPSVATAYREYDSPWHFAFQFAPSVARLLSSDRHSPQRSALCRPQCRPTALRCSSMCSPFIVRSVRRQHPHDGRTAIGLGSPSPHLHRDCAHACLICTGTGLPTYISTGTGLTPCHVCTGTELARRFVEGELADRQISFAVS
jgi:hypothetical protein